MGLRQVIQFTDDFHLLVSSLIRTAEDFRDENFVALRVCQILKTKVVSFRQQRKDQSIRIVCEDKISQRVPPTLISLSVVEYRISQLPTECCMVQVYCINGKEENVR